MAQRQRDLWELSARRVAEEAKRLKQGQTYRQILAERQNPQTGPLSRDSDWGQNIVSTSAVYVNALNRSLQQNRIQDHLTRIRQLHQQTQASVNRMLTRSLPSPSLQDTDKIPPVGSAHDPEATEKMTAIKKRQERTTVEDMARVRDGIDYAVRRFIGRYGRLPNTIYLSAYNHLLLSLENNTNEDEYTNAFGRFRLIQDYTLSDSTIDCEE